MKENMEVRKLGEKPYYLNWYGLALFEKHATNGLNLNELSLLYNLIAASHHNANQEVFPIEFEAREHESSAMGFITPEAAEILDYDYESSGLHDYIASILDDMNNVHRDNQYSFKGVNIYLCRM